MINNIFTGLYEHSVDSKGRVSIPAPYKNAIKDDMFFPVVNTLGNNPFLEIHSFSNLSGLSAEFLRSNAHKLDKRIELDEEGRTVLNKALRDELNLDLEKNPVVFFGMWTCFGLCKKSDWNNVRQYISAIGKSSPRKLAP